jgi:hypothetical protein
MVKFATKLKGVTVFIAGYAIWPYLPLFNEEQFQQKIKLTFPAYSESEKTVRVVSKNQLEYIIRICNQHGKTLAPVGDETPADVVVSME